MPGESKEVVRARRFFATFIVFAVVLGSGVLGCVYYSVESGTLHSTVYVQVTLDTAYPYSYMNVTSDIEIYVDGVVAVSMLLVVDNYYPHMGYYNIPRQKLSVRANRYHTIHAKLSNWNASSPKERVFTPLWERKEIALTIPVSKIYGRLTVVGQNSGPLVHIALYVDGGYRDGTIAYAAHEYSFSPVYLTPGDVHHVRIDDVSGNYSRTLAYANVTLSEGEARELRLDIPEEVER
ncbi:MAG: hypothetical protein AB1665_02485 [Candidatus Thermoplasmatota archaeon]